MAQLRDIETSQVVFQGSVEEAVLLASDIGFDKVLFDDVGTAFDPEAKLAELEETFASDEKLVKSQAKSVAQEDKDAAAERAEVAKERRVRVDDERAVVAQRIQEAQARLKLEV